MRVGFFCLISLFSLSCFASIENYHITDREKELYKWTEAKFQEVFAVEYRDDIHPSGIIKVNDWSGFHINDKEQESVKGLFFDIKNKHTNIVFYGAGEWSDFILVHELAHFFTKKALWKEEGYNWPRAQMESVAFYISHLWMLEQGKSLMDFVAEDKTCSTDRDASEFIDSAEILYLFNYCVFYLHTIRFFEPDPVKAFNLMISFENKGFRR